MTTSRLMTTLAGIAVVFGALTVFSGWQGLFGDAATRAALGHTVGYVLWFNFLAGFAYVAAGWGLWRGARWGLWLATALALGTALVAAAFGVHVLGGGAFEMRTVGALALRLGFWVVVAAVGWRQPS
ncbi:hypothetical protein [Hydrogenophaga sp. SL48]|uniref:hypothetical protein n=1 Tax=Hydrogenophaga sp. SL48 TaxID=2806347 RepID=UPI001F254872|nr:hypothetical protein [Hydrogenophaga sp. SL48]UJW80718.1 hypothetical protein IM738_23260 [Hydrogenophaga sp. SL48]